MRKYISSPTSQSVHEELLKEYLKDKLQAAMKEDITMMRDFDVATEVDHTSLSPTQLQHALDFRLVHRWKGSTVKSRLCTRRCKQHVQYVDSVFASTPSLSSLKLMMTLSLAYIWSIDTFDIVTAFLIAHLH